MHKYPSSIVYIEVCEVTQESLNLITICFFSNSKIDLTSAYARMQSRTHARKHARRRAHTHARTYAITHARTSARPSPHARTHVRTYARTHTLTHTHTHTHTRAHAPTHPPPSPFMLSLFDGSVAPNHDGVNAPFSLFRWRSIAGRCYIQINSRAGDSVWSRDSCVCFSRIKRTALPK